MITKLKEIIENYRNGEYGDNLTLEQILECAKEKDLTKRMSIMELQYLIDNSTGITKMLFMKEKNDKSLEKEINKTFQKIKV